jgi:hypothetical protein
MRRAFVFWQLVAACSAPPSPPPVDAGDVNNPPDAGPVDAGISCPLGSHAAPDGGSGCETGLGWLNATALDTGSNHHGTLIATPDGGSARLYVLGGVSGPAGATVNDAIVSAPIGDDGLLGSWQSAGTLSAPLAGFTFDQRGNDLFVISGISQSGGNLARTRATSIGHLQADGSWGAWTGGPQLLSARFHAAEATVGDFTYVIGGIGESGEVVGTVFRSRFTGTAAGPWQALGNLPDVRSHEAVVVAGQRIYAIAGLRVDSANPSDLYTDVIAADVDGNGDLSAWRTVSTVALDTPVSTHSAFAKDGFLYILGGVQPKNGNLVLTSQVLRAPLLDGGEVGAWESLPPMPKARGHVHQTPLYLNRFIYSAGGTSDFNHDSITSVFIGAFF